MLKEELQLLQEPGSYVGEVVKVMGKSKVLVKVSKPSKRCFLTFLMKQKNLLVIYEIRSVSLPY